SRANASPSRTANQHQVPNGSIWELLLNDERVAQHASSSNLEILPQDVSLDFTLSTPFFDSPLWRYAIQADVTHLARQKDSIRINRLARKQDVFVLLIDTRVT